MRSWRPSTGRRAPSRFCRSTKASGSRLSKRWPRRFRRFCPTRLSRARRAAQPHSTCGRRPVTRALEQLLFDDSVSRAWRRRTAVLAQFGTARGSRDPRSHRGEPVIDLDHHRELQCSRGSQRRPSRSRVHRPPPLTIVVVDNASRDGAPKRRALLNVRDRIGHNPGLAAANKRIRASTGENILLLNSTCRLPERSTARSVNSNGT